MLHKVSPSQELWTPHDTLVRQLDAAPHSAKGLWRANPDLLVEDFGETIQEIQTSIPEEAPTIVVPINNGARLIAAFSIAVARSRMPAHIVGGLNGEFTDNTAELAEKLGWHIVYTPYPSIASGFKAGLEYVRNNLSVAGLNPETGVQAILKTDVDTILPRRYVESTVNKVWSLGSAGVVFGGVVFKGGIESDSPTVLERVSQLTTNVLRDGVAQGKQIVATATGKQRGARGAATAVGLDLNGEFYNALQQIENDEVEDRKIREIAQMLGFPVEANLDFLKSTVITDGRRYHHPLVYLGVHLGMPWAIEKFSNDGIGKVDDQSVFPV